MARARKGAELAAQETQTEVVTTYKGFDLNWQCRGYQFEVGKSYEHEGEVKACVGGFHACEYPLHVLRFYKPNASRFAVVEQSGALSKDSDCSKVASQRLTIKAEIDIAGLVKAAIKYTMDRCTPADGAVSNEPNKSVSASDSNKSATASGNYGAATASGNYGAATASGDSGAATASGYSGAATASGDSGAATASGHSGAATASGYSGAATASGWHGKAKGKKGCAIFLLRRDDDWKITHTFSAIVGQDGIRPDVFYTLGEDGKPREAQ